jgi:DNA-binding transcriptional LysR family regulator
MDTNKLIQLLPDMVTYVTVVETGSFTKAAEKLGVTPSAISKQISRLETALSVVLMERTTRKQVMSEAGREVYEHCRLVIQSAKDAANISNTADLEPSGYLRIAVPKALGKQVLMPHLQSFLQSYPQIKLRVKVTDKHLDPIIDDVDVIFSINDHPAERLICKVLGKVELFLCASSDYLASNGSPTHPQQLAEHHCLHLGESPTDDQWLFSKNEQSIKVKVSARYAVNHTEMRLSGIKQGLGIGILPDFTAESAINNGDIVRVLKDWSIKGSYQGAINMQYAQARYMPKRVRVFVDYMVKAMSS